MHSTTPTSLVLLPGLDGTGVLMRPLVASLPPELSPVVVTYPSQEQLAYRDLIPRVLAAIPAGRPFVLLGESYSGPLALMVAATRPEGLRAVILCATFVRSPHPYVPRFLRHTVRPSALSLFPRFAQLKMLVGGYSTPSLRALSAEALSQVSPAVLAARVREVLCVDVTSELEACPVPVLYLRGRSDRVVPAWNVRAIQRVLPSVTVAVVPSPHLLLQTQPALAVAAILAFLAQAD